MSLPIRSPSHEIETRSKIELEYALNGKAIFRELTGNDYGTDGVIEFINDTCEITGDEILVQLKGTNEITFGKNGFITSPPINTRTANYWLNKQQPVFLILVDVMRRVIYYQEVRSRLIMNMEKLDDQKTITIQINKSNTFDSTNPNRLKFAYQKVRDFVDFKNELSQTLKNHKSTYKYLLENSGKDCFMVIDSDDSRINKLEEIRQSLISAFAFFGLNGRIYGLKDYHKQSYKDWEGDLVEMHITKTAEHLQGQLRSLLKVIYNSRNTYSTFWKKNDPRTHEAINKLDKEKSSIMIMRNEFSLKDIKTLDER